MSYYELLVTVHVLAAITWVGSELHIFFQRTRAHARGPEAEAAFALDFMRWGNAALPLAAIIAGITGVLAVIEGPWEFSEAWVSVALTVWVLSFISGVAFFGPTGKRLTGFLEEDGDTITDRSAALVQRMMLVLRVEFVLLVIVVVVMVTKPGA